MNEKVVFIGAGSAIFTRGTVYDMIERGWEGEIALVDINADALEVTRRLIEKMIVQSGSKLKLSASTRRRDLLPGATVVIAILASMLLPALSKARAKAQSIKCTSNAKQQGLQFMMYANNFDGNFPKPNRWTTLLMLQDNNWWSDAGVLDAGVKGMALSNTMWGCPVAPGKLVYNNYATSPNQPAGFGMNVGLPPVRMRAGQAVEDADFDSYPFLTAIQKPSTAPLVGGSTGNATAPSGANMSKLPGGRTA